MANLYELTNQMLQLQEALEYGAETPEQEAAIIAQMEAVAVDFDAKADGYAKVIKNMSAQAEAIRTEEKRLAARRKVLENGIDRLKDAIYSAMMAVGTRKVQTTIGSWGIQKNPPSVAVTDEKAIPAEYWITPPPVLDKQALREDLKQGCLIAGCELQQTESVRFR